MQETYIKKYATSFYYWFYFLGIVYVASFAKLYQYYGVTTKQEDFMVFLSILIIITLFTLLAIVLKYRVVYLYNDRLVMQNAFKTVLMEVEFSNIKRIGFLNATTDSTRSSNNNAQAVDMVMLLKDGGSEELDSTIITDLDLIYQFINERITED